MTKKMVPVAAVLTAGLGLACDPTAQAVRSPAAVQATKAPTAICTGNDNGVDFRLGPGNDYPVPGRANRGQHLNFRGRQGNCVMGDLWGGPTGVWIHMAFLDY
ncbi:SH3 domain-containing protein [Streptomyces sp. NPDC058439]|uniref:SH3 domain-containing protein n=1 Tax=Streptomyces sp. NPDC058439 TaxID=3346500 RepID=UPI0036647321